MMQMHKILAASVVGVNLAGAGFAADVPLPDYFVQSVVHSTAAESLAQHCVTLSLNPATISANSTDTLQRLSADGVNVEAASEATLAATNIMIRDGLNAFLDKHNLKGAEAKAACAAGLIEISEETVVGSFLREVVQ